MSSTRSTVLYQNEGLTLKPMTLKTTQDCCSDSMQEKVRMEMTVQSLWSSRGNFLLSLDNKCQGSYCQWLLLLTGVGVYFSQQLLSKVGNNKLQ